MQRISVLAMVVCASVSCGKKGPPLAPFVRVPAAVAGVTPQRIGDDVYLSFKVPSTNADGQKPALLGTLEVYAITSERAPDTKKQRDLATLIATLPVRPILPAPPPAANGSPPPAIPLPPGVDQDAEVVVREPLTPEAFVPVELPVDDNAPKPPDVVPPRVLFEDERQVTPPPVAPLPTQRPPRRYFVIGVSPRGSKGAPSTPVSVPLEPVSSAPGAPVITHTATTMTVTWAPSPDARTATVQPPPTVKPTVGANATPANVTPALPPLQAKSLGFNSHATGYYVYDVTPPVPTDPETPKDPYAIQLPARIGVVSEPELLIKSVNFGIERCFVVRPVDSVFGVAVVGPASTVTCITPQDTFPPAAPTSLAAIAGSGVISLIWDPNTEADLAGYIVLRGEAPGDTLQAITPEPISVTSFRDETVKPGTRYVYAVVAVDGAVPQNGSPLSNRAEETARQ